MRSKNSIAMVSKRGSRERQKVRYKLQTSTVEEREGRRAYGGCNVSV